MKWKRLLGLAAVVAIACSLALPGTIFAASSANITVTGTPLFLSITNAPNTWTINGITGTGTINVDTKYYSNPLGDTVAPSATVDDGECQFNVSVAAGATTCDLTVNFGNFSGGNAIMTNSNDKAVNGATEFAAATYCTGMTYADAIVAKSSGSAEFNADGIAAGDHLDWGLMIETRTDAWTGSGASTATVTITATEH